LGKRERDEDSTDEETKKPRTGDYFKIPEVNTFGIPFRKEEFKTENKTKTTKRNKKKLPSERKKSTKPEKKEVPRLLRTKEFDIAEQMQKQEAGITWSQLLQLPGMKRTLMKNLKVSRKVDVKTADQEYRPRVTSLKCAIDIDGYTVPAIVDSGAAVSMITRDTMEQLGYSIDEPSNSVILPAVGEGTRPLGVIRDFPVTVAGYTIPVDVEVTEATTYTLILGNNWLLKANGNYNWQSQELTLRWRNQHLVLPASCIRGNLAEIPETTSEEESETSDEEIESDNQHENESSETEEDDEDETFEDCIEYSEEEINFSEGNANESDNNNENESENDIESDNSNSIESEYEESNSESESESDSDDDKDILDEIPVMMGDSLVETELNVGTLSTKQQEQFNQLLEENQDMFATDISQLGRTNIIQHKIDTGIEKPVKQRFYRSNPIEEQFIEEEIQRLLQKGLVVKSFSPWASPVVVVGKKNGKQRLCVDYRKVNALTKKDAYPIPRIDDMLSAMQGAKWFTTLDLASGYWQVEMDPSDREKTAFIVKQGTYEFTVMPFGLTNAPATFQRLMNQVFNGLLYKGVIVYLDDINIYSKTFEEQIDRSIKTATCCWSQTRS
jgi:hypothetical protein